MDLRAQLWRAAQGLVSLAVKPARGHEAGRRGLAGVSILPEEFATNEVADEAATKGAECCQ
eukprot:2517379-Lingulodinium_polyedra.AAC.1